ncbi:MAG: mechanosensitive ion channel [Planctomycetaceae bacterium]|jgi:small-conductance mechanosensitive channel|nr:mechanosensitive ion channel [Planctomycetaceae bacterium]
MLLDADTPVTATPVPATAEVTGLWNQIQEMAVSFTPKLGAAIAVLFLFWLGGKILMRITQRIGNSNHVDAELTNFMGRSIKVGMMLFGIVTALGTLGIDIGALVAGLGLTGFALGFALKDTISNLLSGIMVIIYKPFDQDDIITVGKFEGVVKSVDLRYTVLEVDGRTVFVPNAKLFVDAIMVDNDGRAAAAKAAAEAAQADEGPAPLPAT